MQTECNMHAEVGQTVIGPRGSSMLVQITYEVQTPEEAVALARRGRPHWGAGRKRRISARAYDGSCQCDIRRITARATRVALSLSADPAEIARVVEHTRPDIIHIGAAVELFSIRDTQALKAAFPNVRVMRSIPIIDEASVEYANDYRGIADFLLLDSHEPGDRQIGGLGRTHDWSISRRIVDEVGVPVILAGGLSADNVAAAIAAVRPAGVASKTKTDRADCNGKDLDKVRRFVTTAKLTTSRQ